MFLVICKLNKLIGTWDEDSLPGMQEQGKTNTPRNTACKSSECINQKNRLSSRQAPPVAIDAFLFCYLGGVWKATVNTIPKHSTNPTNTHKLWDFEELWAVFCVSAVLPTLTPAVCFKHKTPKCLYFSRTISCFQHCEQVFNCILEKKLLWGFGVGMVGKLRFQHLSPSWPARKTAANRGKIQRCKQIKWQMHRFPCWFFTSATQWCWNCSTKHSILGNARTG